MPCRGERNRADGFLQRLNLLRQFGLESPDGLLADTNSQWIVRGLAVQNRFLDTYVAKLYYNTITLVL